MSVAARIHGAGDLRVGPYAPAPAKPGEVDVDVAAVGICGSDLHYYKDGGIGGAVIATPFVPGHEFSARLTRDVESRGLRRGQLVAVDPATPCHRCEWCRAGHHNLCPNVVFLGAPPHDGALTPRLAVPEASLIPLPDGMTAEEGAMLEPLGVCIHAMDLARPAVWDSVAVVGCGPIGLGILQLLVLAGCREIVAVDPQAHRVAFAREIGATAGGDSTDAIRDATSRSRLRRRHRGDEFAGRLRGRGQGRAHRREDRSGRHTRWGSLLSVAGCRGETARTDRPVLATDGRGVSAGGGVGREPANRRGETDHAPVPAGGRAGGVRDARGSGGRTDEERGGAGRLGVGIRRPARGPVARPSSRDGRTRV